MRTFVIATVLASLLAASSAGAQPAVSAPASDTDATLAALVSEALARNPEILATQRALEAALTRPEQARALPDASLSAVYTNDGGSFSLGSSEFTNLAFTASQGLPWPGKRDLRAEVATRDAGEAGERLTRSRLATVAAVKRAWYSLTLSRQLLALVDERETIWREIEGVARARYAIGQGTQSDVLRVQVELTRIEQPRSERQGEADSELAEINRLLDRDPATPISTPAVLSLAPEARGAEELEAWADSASPELKSGALELEREKLQGRLASLDLRPDMAVQGGYMYRGSLVPMWVAGVTLSLPIDTRRARGAAAEARARASETEHRIEAVRAALRTRTRSRLSRLKSDEKVSVLYNDGIIPQDQLSVESAVASYQAGKIPFISVLEAIATLYGDKETSLRTVADHAAVLAALESASLEDDGAMPAPSAGSGRMTSVRASVASAPAPAMAMR